jgi:mono/diheme cytochrome c family protein
MTRTNWIHVVLAILLALLVLFFIRMHVAFGQFAPDQAESGRHYAMAWCTQCHSVQPETDGTGKFAPDFTVIAQRPSTSARSLYVFLHTSHNIMPDFVLKPAESRDIVAYILTLKK